MKAYQIQTAAGIDGLKLVDLPEPQLGAGQILVRVRATSLNYRDTAVVSGMYPGQTLPVIPLSDGAGEVVALDEGVTRVKEGDRVAGIFFQDWIAGKLTREKSDILPTLNQRLQRVLAKIALGYFCPTPLI
jgi:NADPH:quinone reductase-like Zn-dependent oxidoreductase